jgi:predicted metalloprotease with PDZ domain
VTVHKRRVVKRKTTRILPRQLGRPAIALLLGVSMMALVIAIAEKESEIGIGGQRSVVAEEVFGNAVGATAEPLDRATARSLAIPADEKGLVVTSVAWNGPAARAGVRAGDVIERIGATPTASLKDAAVALEVAHTPIKVTLNSRGHYAIVTLPTSPARENSGMEQGDAH